MCCMQVECLRLWEVACYVMHASLDRTYLDCLLMSLHMQIKYFGRSHRAHGWPLAATSFQATLTVAVAVTVALTSRSASYFVDWMSAVRCDSSPIGHPAVALHSCSAHAGPK